MYCKNCGQPMEDVASVCVNCGTSKGVGNHYCPNCGAETEATASVCLKCGVALKPASVISATGPKSKMVAGLLAILLGTLGIHNFYLGYNKKGLIQLLVSLLLSWTFVAPVGIAIWAIYEAVMIFTDKLPAADGTALQ